MLLHTVLLIFVSVLFLALAANSTTYGARIKRTTVVYELVAIFLMYHDANFLLGIIEFAIFQIIAIFSAISCLYAWADTELTNSGPSVTSSNTALIVLPIKRDRVEVDEAQISAMENLSAFIMGFSALILMILRAILLFPYYGKNWVSFFICLLIIFVTALISYASGGQTYRAVDCYKKEGGVSVLLEVFLISAFFILTGSGLIQGIAFFAYSFADDVASEKTRTESSTPVISENLLPINHAFQYGDDLPRVGATKALDLEAVTDNVYLVFYKNSRYDRNSYDTYYYYLDSNSRITDVDDKYAGSYVDVKLVDSVTPHVEVYETYYTNPKGETAVTETRYIFYLTNSQILTVE